jgi:hypothetical protein
MNRGWYAITFRDATAHETDDPHPGPDWLERERSLFLKSLRPEHVGSAAHPRPGLRGDRPGIIRKRGWQGSNLQPSVS